MSHRLRRAVRGDLLAVLLLAFGGPALSEPNATSQVDESVRRSVAEFLKSRHLPPDLVDVELLASEAARRATKAGSVVGLESWLNEEINRASWAFAPLDANPDQAAHYALPFDPAFPRFVNQGPGGALSHQGRVYHAHDFVMPIGTPVRAARRGVVSRVIDGFKKGGPDKALLPFANRIFVLHDDGTVAEYAHLSAGIPVKTGEPVARAQEIAESGNTGYSGAPHLHFAVYRNRSDGPRSIPIRFGRPGTRGFLPKPGGFTGKPPKRTLDLALHVNGKSVPRGTVLSARTGDELEFRVEAGSPARDLTRDPDLQLVSLTPWILEVAGPGRVAFRPMPGYAPDWGLGLNVAVVGVYLRNPERREVGYEKLQIRITDRKGPGKVKTP